jgi:hypothetical protein
MAGGLLGPIEVVEGIAIGTGVGQAIGDVVTPKLQGFKNERWQKYPDKPLSPGDAALASVKGFATALNLAEEAAKNGMDGDHFGVLVQNLRKYPGTGELLELWRRGRLSRDEVDLALNRAGIPVAYRDAVLDLFTGRLDPAIIAVAIQRGIMRDPGILPVGPPTGVGKVPKFPVSPLDTLAEAKAHGIDLERLFVETAIVGLPASPDLAARATFRNIIDRVDFDRAIAEGNTRNEWADAIFNAFREILTANQYAELQLRGFLTRDERLAETDKHGMSTRDSDLLFDVLGRAPAVHAITTGLARGGVFNGPVDTIPRVYLSSMQRGNLRPEYYNLAYANRYSYPSAFVLRALLTGGVLTADEGYDIFLKIGWPPGLARKVADHYGTGTGAVAVDPLVKSAHTRALTLLRNAYVARRVDDAFATDRLNALGIAGAVQTPLLEAWRIMQTIPGAGLTRAQVKKAFKSLPAEWPRDRALTELEDLGMEPAEAQTYLDE